jgi:DNA polymerase-3 subunit gamma/tau
MSSQVFYRRWRPQTLAEVLGQEQITQTLLNALATGRVAHAYLFCGPRGTGKTSTGRILAKAVNCLNNGRGEPCNACSMCQAINEGRALDLVEIDAASNRGIDEIRDLRERVNFAPNIARYKVYIIDEVHMLTEPAFNALLKTLEEPPPHIIFVLATTEVHKVPLTIISRCQRFDFRRLSQAAIVSKLKQICVQEGIQIEPQALVLIARSATGSLRDAENLLEQLVIYHGSDITNLHVQKELGIVGDERIRQLAGCILRRDIAGGLTAINSVCDDGLDLRQFNRELVEYLRGVLLLKAGAGKAVDLSPETIDEMKMLGEGISLEEISRAIKLFSQADFRSDPQATLPLELALVDCASYGNEETEGAVKSPPRGKAAEVARPEPRSGKAAEVARPEPTLGEAAEVARPEPTLKEAAEVAGPELSPEIERIRGRWKDFVKACRGEGSSGNLDALLRGFCRPVALEGDTLVLGFSAEFHKSKIEDPKYRHLVEKKLGEIFHAPYRVRCVLLDREQMAKPETAGDNRLLRAALEMGARIVSEEQNE